MDQRELDLMLMQARAAAAERTLRFVLEQIPVLLRGASAEQTRPFRDRLRAALEEVARHVERDLLRERGWAPEERALLADEFRAILEELRRQIGG